jgi:hypothetical protein
MDGRSGLKLPNVRRELILYLAELAVDDPRATWQAERQQGLWSGIDEVFHFFFDDHDFDETDVGAVFFDRSEVEIVAAVKRALEAVLLVVGNRGDDEFVQHALWPNVTHTARAAREQLSAAS